MFDLQVSPPNPTSTTTPYPFLGSGPIHRRVLFQRLVLSRHHQTPRTNNAVVGYPHRMMHARTGCYSLSKATRRLEKAALSNMQAPTTEETSRTTADFEQVVVLTRLELVTTVELQT